MKNLDRVLRFAGLVLCMLVLLSVLLSAGGTASALDSAPTGDHSNIVLYLALLGVSLVGAVVVLVVLLRRKK